MALMGMWVRSYRTLRDGDELHTYWADGQDMVGLLLYSTDGEMILYEAPLSFGSAQSNCWPWIVFRGPDGSYLQFQIASLPQLEGNRLGFGYERSSSASGVILPYWFLVLASGSLAMLFQLRWPPRFTLRHLFIATTFLAVVLGMIAWLDRAWIGK
jgi:hypothetical protein